MPLAARRASTRPTLQNIARAHVRRLIDGHRVPMAAVSEAIGQKPNWVSRYLSGQFDADLDQLAAIAEFFKIRFSDLLNVPPPTVDDGELWQLYGALPAEKQAVVLQVVRAFFSR